MAAGSAHCLLLQVSKATLFQENSGWSAACQESFRPLFTSYVNSRERKLRQKLLEQYFSLDAHPQSYPGEYCSCELLLDLLDGAMSFAVDQGLPCYEVQLFLSFYVSCLELIAGDGNEIPSMLSIIQHFKDVTIPNFSSHLSPSSLHNAVKYITESVFQHFHLYQFLLTQPQVTDTTTLERAVETLVEDPLDLSEGIIEETWIKTKKKNDLEAEYDRRVKELEVAGTKETELADANLQHLYETLLTNFTNGPQKVSPEDLSGIVDTLMKAHIESAQVMISQHLLKKNLDFSLKLDQLELFLPPSMKARAESAKKSKSPATGKKSKSPATGKKSKSPATGKKPKSPATGKMSKSPAIGKTLKV